jgi:hypothetical protein
MLNQIQIVNQCLRDLQDSELANSEKLKLEDQLFQLKRLLMIPEVEAMVKGDARSEKEFIEIHKTFQKTNVPPR